MSRDIADFHAILDQLYFQYLESYATPFAGCYEALKARADDILRDDAYTYVPGHKLTEFLADLVNIAASITSQGWLSESQAHATFHELTAANSPLMRHFTLDARIEEARNAPLMLDDRGMGVEESRLQLLTKRLELILTARQSDYPLPDSFIAIIREAAQHAFQAECFRHYRYGPLLQMVDDMLTIASDIAYQMGDEAQGQLKLRLKLKVNSALWKRYKYKSSRFRQPDAPVDRQAYLFNEVHGEHNSDAAASFFVASPARLH